MVSGVGLWRISSNKHWKITSGKEKSKTQRKDGRKWRNVSPNFWASGLGCKRIRKLAKVPDAVRNLSGCKRKG